MPDDPDYFSAGGDPGADSQGFSQPADTGGVPPTNANDSTSSSASSSVFVDALKQYGGTVLDAAKSYYQFQAARGQQQVSLAQQRANVTTQLSKAETDRQVALLNGEATVATAQAKANAAQVSATRAAAGSFSDNLTSGKYNSLIIVLTLAGLGFSYLQSVHHE